MAKQRNSLGVLVLPVPDNESFTWDEYRDLYGIDLTKLFEIVLDESGYGVYYKGSRKLIALSTPESLTRPSNDSARCLPLVIVNNIENQVNLDIDDAYMILKFANNNADLSILVYANKTIVGELA